MQSISSDLSKAKAGDWKLAKTRPVIPMIKNAINQGCLTNLKPF